MFRRYFNDFDDFDDFFVPFYRRRRHTPRRLLQNGNSDRAVVPFENEESEFANQLANFQGPDWNQGFDVSNFEMKEDGSGYHIALTIPDVKQKEVKVDFVKSENKLVILVSHKKEDKNAHSYYLSSYSRSMVLDKEVNAGDINAQLSGDGVTIDIPKVESDVVNVAVEGSGVTHLLDAVPAEEETTTLGSEVEEEKEPKKTKSKKSKL